MVVGMVGVGCPVDDDCGRRRIAVSSNVPAWEGAPMTTHETEVDPSRLSMPIGEAMFTQRAIRRYRPDPIPIDDLQLVLEAAVRAPNGGNQQVARFLVVTDRDSLRAFGALYREAWWAKRHDEGFADFEALPARFPPAAGLADAMGGVAGDVPCVVHAFAVRNGSADSVIPAVQNLMLAARALGIGSVPTTLHPAVMTRVYDLFAVPSDVAFHFCVPLGYPQGNFGPNVRRPTRETTYLDRWDGPVPWA